MQERDALWEAKFLDFLANTKVKVLSPDPQTGPDQWPYLMVATEPELECTEPVQKIVDWLSTKGMGLVVNPAGEFPDYVLTYGMVWNFKVRQRFLSPLNPGSPSQVEYTLKNLVHAGTPTEEYLPLFVRQILREFFRDQGVLAPRILLLSQDRKNYDLAFSAESLGNPPSLEWQGIAEAISWFLPAHYSILIVSEKDLPEFQNL